MNAAQSAETDMAAQFEVVRQLIARGYNISACGPRGEVVLTRGEDYRPGLLAYVLTVLTLGVWLLVIAGQSALQRRDVVTVWPDGAVVHGAVDSVGRVRTSGDAHKAAGGDEVPAGLAGRRAAHDSAAGGPQIPQTLATLLGVILIGAIGAVVASMFSPLVALVVVPLVVVCVGRWPRGESH